MTPALLLGLTVRPVLAWMAEACGIPHTAEAERMLLAIAMQETALRHRRQVPVAHAMGFWQFERGGGVAGVLRHRSTAERARAICEALLVKPEAAAVHPALEQNDALACAFARLLLWTDPMQLPRAESQGWACYLRLWRPGRPHPATWPEAWAAAERAIAGYCYDPITAMGEADINFFPLHRRHQKKEPFPIKFTYVVLVSDKHLGHH